MDELELLSYYSNSYTSELLSLIQTFRLGISRAAKRLELSENSILTVLFMLSGTGPNKVYYDFSWIGYFLHDSLCYTICFIKFLKTRKLVPNNKIYYNNTTRDPCSYCLYDRTTLIKGKTGYRAFQGQPDDPRPSLFLEADSKVVDESGRVADLSQASNDYNIQCLQILYGWIADIDSKKLATSYSRQYLHITKQSIQSIAKLQESLLRAGVIKLVKDPVYWQIAVLVARPSWDFRLPSVQLIKLEKTSLVITRYTSDQWLTREPDFLQALLATLRIYNLYKHYQK